MLGTNAPCTSAARTVQMFSSPRLWNAAIERCGQLSAKWLPLIGGPPVLLPLELPLVPPLPLEPVPCVPDVLPVELVPLLEEFDPLLDDPFRTLVKQPAHSSVPTAMISRFPMSSSASSAPRPAPYPNAISLGRHLLRWMNSAAT